MTRLEYRHNDGYDSVILVDENTHKVLSDWTVDKSVIKDFCDCSQDASDWDDRGDNEHEPNDYGEIVAVRKGYELTANEPLWSKRIEFFLR